jgi:hypothetical protein
LESVKRSVAFSTWQRYETMIRLHFIPSIVRLRLTRLSPLHLEQLYMGRLDRGLSATAVLQLHRILHHALRDAIRWNLVQRNVTEFVTPPRKANFEFQILSHHPRQAVERARAGREWDDRGLVFANTLGRPLHPRNFLLREFYPLLEQAGLPRMRFHDLRHSAATLLLELGIHPKVVSEMLGHSQIGITLDLYSHVTATMQQQAVTALDDLFHDR